MLICNAKFCDCACFFEVDIVKKIHKKQHLPKKYKVKPRAGFTLIEILAVVVILAILAAVGVPSMIGFIRHGQQVNRMNIARTLYLAAQNQLTRSVAEGTLRETLTRHFYIDDETDDLISVGLVAEQPGVLFPTADEENRPFVFYISKPARVHAPTGDPLLDDFYNLLDGVIIDKTILDGAILMEFNAMTGVVMSIFYGDHLSGQGSGQWEFVYSDANNGISGGRGMEAYTPTANNRRQGYYGVGETGRLPEVPQLDDIVNIYDGADAGRALDVGEGGAAISKRNILYAEFLLAEPTDQPITLEIIDASNRSSLVSAQISATGIATSFETALIMAATSGHIVYRDMDADIVVDHFGVDVGGNYSSIIWVSDYID